MKTLKTTLEASEKMRAFTLVELLVTITIICILASLLFSALARAKAKTNRIKCVNNQRQIGMAFRNFADNNNNRLPLQLTRNGLRYYFGDEDERSTKTIFSLRAMKEQIGGAKLLASPCDGQAVAANEVAQENWTTYDTKSGKMIPCDAISYNLIEGADMARPGTMIAATRNLSTKDLATATWNGANQKSPPENVLSGLNNSQGQAVFADGSARQASDSDVGPEGEVVKAHRSSTGGVSIGPASTAVIGCCGDVVIVSAKRPTVIAKRTEKLSAAAWNDKNGYRTSYSFGYILEKNGGYEVIRVKGNINWYDSKKAAEKLGGHLATITSQKEWTKVRALSGYGPGLWLGGYQPSGSSEPGGGWTWVTGEPWGVTAWSSSEPNNATGYGNENCLITLP